MEEKNIIFRLRREKGLSQEDLAEKVFVTRQAVSRWENRGDGAGYGDFETAVEGV